MGHLIPAPKNVMHGGLKKKYISEEFITPTCLHPYRDADGHSQGNRQSKMHWNQFPSLNFAICTTHYIRMLQYEEQENMKFLI